MRLSLCVIGLGAVVAMAAAGCYYQRMDIEGLYGKIQLDMTKSQVVKILGNPSSIQGGELFYLYDDPEKPVRLRIVLDDQDRVVAKYYEPRSLLSKRAEEMKGQPPTVNTLPTEEKRAYPGGPLERFSTKKPGEY